MSGYGRLFIGITLKAVEQTGPGGIGILVCHDRAHECGLLRRKATMRAQDGFRILPAWKTLISGFRHGREPSPLIPLPLLPFLPCNLRH